MKYLLMIALLLPMTASARRSAEMLNIPYGPHARNVFDLWMPKKKWFGKKSPLVIFIHGGGWAAGSKDDFRNRKLLIEKYNQKGIAVAAMNYRFLVHAPLQTIMREDIAGFVQFMRSHSDDYRIDKDYIYAYGISAGASASLWLATHDDLADPNSPDPIKRESSRVAAAGHINGQVSYDYMVWYQFLGKENTDRFMRDQVWSRYGSEFHSVDDLFTPEGIRVRKFLDMIGQMSADDAPLMFMNTLEDDLTRDGNHFIHSPIHARLLAQQARAFHLDVETYIRADDWIPRSEHLTTFDFFVRKISEKRTHQPRRKFMSNLFSANLIHPIRVPHVAFSSHHAIYHPNYRAQYRGQHYAHHRAHGKSR